MLVACYVLPAGYMLICSSQHATNEWLAIGKNIITWSSNCLYVYAWYRWVSNGQRALLGGIGVGKVLKLGRLNIFWLSKIHTIVLLVKCTKCMHASVIIRNKMLCNWSQIEFICLTFNYECTDAVNLLLCMQNCRLHVWGVSPP